MKRIFFIGTLAFITVLLASVQSSVFGATMSDYCQAPPYISAVVAPNVMLALDVSGSMSYAAYKTSQEGSHHKYCSNNLAMECDNNSDCSRKYCSNQPSHHCDDNNDCEDHGGGTCLSPVPATGTCAESGTSALPYGYCSNSLTTTCEVNATCGVGNTCIPRMTYEGYFTPSASYVIGADSVYREYTPSGTPCTIKYTYPCKSKSGGSCPSGSTATKPADALNTCSGSKPCYGTPKGNPTSSSGDCGTEDSGNLLNYRNMERIDLLRWAMTGGSPTTCDASDIGKCDPRVYLDSGMQASGKVGAPGVCRDDLQLNSTGTVTGHGCVLLSDNNTKVAVPWSRISEGLIYEFQAMPVQPRMGAMFYEGTTVKSNYVYVGDFTSANSRTAYTFQNLLTEINATDPGGYTPSGPALWDVFNYFKQVNPEYGGISPQSGSGDMWKNPLYDCPDKGGGNCNFIPCTKSFVMLMSDGLWNQGGGPPATNTCSINTGYELHSADPVVPSYKMHMGYTNVKAGASGTATKVTAVYTVGLFVSVEGEKALQNTAIYGSFDNAGKTWPSNRTNYPGKQSGDPVNCAITTSGAACPSNQGTGSNCNALPASSLDWDKNSDGVPDTFFYAEDALTIRSEIMKAIQDMLSRVASGTAASVLASGEGSGANLIQSVFYPRRPFFDGAEISWTSTLQNLWYYINPRTANSTIRENTADSSGATAKELNLTLDYIVNFYFDPADQKTKAHLYTDTDGDGIKGAEAAGSPVEPPDLKYLWEAGLTLWNKNAAVRNIYTPLNTGLALTNSANVFTTANLATIRPKLNTDVALNTIAQNNAVATNMINYVRGTDLSDCSAGTCGSAITYRSRTGSIDQNKDGDILDTVNGIPEAAKVWKLGDMINATPKIASWVPLNNYNTSYGDSTYTTFTESSTYTNRGMVFAGANDGMLHAFKLGTLGFAGTGYCSVTTATVCTDNAGCPSPETCNRYELASLSGSNLGNEEWAFIPSRALPYLQYLADPDYCHLYYVDTTPVIFDASFNKPSGCSSTNYWDCTKDSSSWRTVLIGGMRLGGGCKGSAYTGSYGVKGPTATAGEGYSSYFAIDITDPATPQLLWEFAPTDGSLGFASSGPAVVKINARVAGATNSTADKSKNGRWFVVFASGPTGPIQQSQFKGFSDQNLKLFVLDLATGSLLRTIDTSITNAFGGSLTNAPIDYDFDYQDDALYMGYTKSEVAPPVASTKWTQGGVLRLVTNEDLNSNTLPGGTALDPANWTLSSVMTDIGTVTASVGHLAHYKTNSQKPDKAYLYFGTGRYYYNNTTAGADDPSNQRRIYGIDEPCLTNILANTACSSSVAVSSLSEAATSAGTTDPDGWYINLDAATSTTNSERIITDPLAAPLGAVFFTSLAPTNDVCSFGGNSYLWAVKYDTGGAVAFSLSGVGLLQVSTGAIEEVNLRDDFGSTTDATHRYGRRSDAMSGVPPLGQGLALVIPPKPTNKVLHIRKK